MATRRNRATIRLIPAALFLSLSLAAATLAGQEADLKDVPRIENPAQAPGGLEHWYLEQEWLVGDEDSELLIGLPTRVAVDGQGRLYILDAHLNQVHVFSQSGEHLATRFREGDGPGEIRNPSDLIVWPDGALGVVQEFPGQVVCLDAKGDPAPTLHPGGDPESGGFSVLMNGRARGGSLAICGMMTRQNDQGERERNAYLSLFDRDGRQRACLLEENADRPSGPPSETDLLKPYFLAWDVGPDGRVYASMSWDEYRIFVWDTEGGLERIIERDYEPWRRTQAEKDKINAFFSATAGDPGMTLDLADQAPCISVYQRGLQVAEDGNLWVHSSRGNRNLPDGVLAVFDVFAPDGEFAKQVAIHCPGDPWNDHLFILSRDRVIRTRRFVDALVTSLGPGGLPADQGNEEDLTPAVISYRVKR